jgi:histidyl-tRNA synthetase
VGIDAVVDPRLVRGLDYYSRTVWEFTSSALGAQSAVGGGGRYDGLVPSLGGPATPAVGFGTGVERLCMCVEAMELSSNPADMAPLTPAGSVYIGVAPDSDTSAWAAALTLAVDLRRAGVVAALDVTERSAKGQAKQASRAGNAVRVLVGQQVVECFTPAARDPRRVARSAHARTLTEVVRGELSTTPQLVRETARAL